MLKGAADLMDGESVPFGLHADISWKILQVAAVGGFGQQADIIYLIQVHRGVEGFKFWMRQEVEHETHTYTCYARTHGVTSLFVHRSSFSCNVHRKRSRSQLSLGLKNKDVPYSEVHCKPFLFQACTCYVTFSQLFSRAHQCLSCLDK